ncbi:hypothetical protein [Helicobacter sp. 23-1045]
MGASFALVKILGISQTPSLVSHPKNFKTTKLPPQNTRIVFKGKKTPSLRENA